jgi:hypothetical protein
MLFPCLCHNFSGYFFDSFLPCETCATLGRCVTGNVDHRVCRAARRVWSGICPTEYKTRRRSVSCQSILCVELRRALSSEHEGPGKCHLRWWNSGHGLLSSSWRVYFLINIPLMAQWSFYVPPDWTSINSTFCPHSVFVCFVWIWGKKRLFLYTALTGRFVQPRRSVYCAVRTGSLYIIQVNLSLLER